MKDATVVRAVAWIRLAVVVAAGAAGTLLPVLSPRAETIAVVVSMAGVPWAVVQLFASEHPDRPIVAVGVPAGDFALVLALGLVDPGAQWPLIAYVVPVAVAAYIRGAGLASALAGVSIGLAAATGNSAAALALLACSETILIGLLSRLTARLDAAEARSTELGARAATILDHVREAVVVTDAGGTVRQLNGAARDLIAGSATDEVAGRRCEQLLGLHAGERALDCGSGRCQLLAAPALRANDPRDVELWRQLPDGRRQPLLASVSIVRSSTGEVTELVHSLRDITTLKQADEAKTLFLATASHELRTPLTVIGGFAELLLTSETMDDETRTLALKAVKARVDQLASIVDRLLLSSRIEAGRATVRPEPTDIVPLLRERAASLEQATGRRVTVQVAGSDLPPAAADPVAVATVIDHLLDNAVKYSPDGQVVSIEGWCDGDTVAFDVVDHGIGMSTSERARCFDKFWQAETTDGRRFGGTGIGLYVVRALVESMNGTVNVDSSPGWGSRFVVALRRADETAAGAGGERLMIREFMRQLGVPEPATTVGAGVP